MLYAKKKKTKHRIEHLACSSYRHVARKGRHGCFLVNLMVPAGDASQDLNSSSTVHSRRRSRTRSSQCHPAPHPCGARGVPGEWTDVCGFVKPPRSQSERLTRKHGAFEINRQVIGLSLKDQTYHYEVRIHLCHVSARSVDRTRESKNHKRDVSRQPTKKSRSWNPCETMCSVTHAP